MSHAPDDHGDARGGSGRTGAGPVAFAETRATMESIFGPAAVTTSMAPPVDHARPVERARPARRRRPGLWLAGLGLAAIAGTAIGFTAFENPAPVVARAPLQSAAKATLPPAVAPAPIHPAPVANLAVAATPSDEPDAGVADERVAGRGEDTPPVVQRPPRLMASAMSQPVRTPCGHREGGARITCLSDRLQAADRDLVDAYEAATDAGVRRDMLVSVNRRWEDAREIARDDPADALEAYRDLTAELWRAQRGGERLRGE